jgi:glycosyltransferase involved in cell wall biosynthesis
MRLIRAIFPCVRERYPQLMLYIVGDQPPPELQQMAGKGVVVTGYVPDVTPYLDEASLVVVPLRLGGGNRVKLREALAAGKAVVATPTAVAGQDLVDGEEVVLAESDQQFCHAIIQLLSDPERRAALGARARLWACANLGWQHAIARHEALYESLITGQR